MESLDIAARTETEPSLQDIYELRRQLEPWNETEPVRQLDGATGNIGRHLVPALVTRGAEVRVLVRDADRARSVLGAVAEDPLVDLAVGDLADAAAVRGALKGVEGAYLATNGADQVQLEQEFIAAARQMELGHMVKVSVIGATPDSPVWLAWGHAAIEQTLTTSGIPATLLRPNWFMENFHGSAPTITAQSAIYGSAGRGRVAFVDFRDTAAVAAAVLTGAGHASQEYVVTGPAALTFAEAAEAFSRALGRTVSYIDLDDEQFRSALTGNGLPEPVAEVFGQINRNARAGNLAKVSTTVADLTGSPARDMRASCANTPRPSPPPWREPDPGRRWQRAGGRWPPPSAPARPRRHRLRRGGRHRAHGGRRARGTRRRPVRGRRAGPHRMWDPCGPGRPDRSRRARAPGRRR